MRKILIIRFSSIGDIVLTTPVVRCVKQQLKDIELHVLTKKKYAGLYISNPYVDKVHEFDNSLRDVIRELKKENFDFVADLQRNMRSRKVRCALKCRNATFNKLDLKKLLYTTLKINILPDVHIVERYFEAVSSIGVKNDGRGLDFFIGDVNQMSESDIPEEFRDGFYAVSIGGSYPTKVMPDDMVVELIKRLGEPVILLGGNGDMERAARITEAVGKNVGNPVGKINLEQSASIIKMSKALLTGDTGMMHIAAALHKPVVSVWGNTVPEFGMYPYMPENQSLSQIVEYKGLRCRPCSKLGYKQCPKGHFKCMRNLNIDEIVAKLKHNIE